MLGTLPKEVNVLVGSTRLTLQEPTQLKVRDIIRLFKKVKREEGQEFSWGIFICEYVGEIAPILLDTAENRETVGVSDKDTFSELVQATLTFSQGVTLAAGLTEVFDLEELVKQVRAPVQKLKAKMSELGVSIVEDPAPLSKA